VIFGKAFFDLQLQFAQNVVRLSGLPLARVLLDYTNLYVRFGLGRAFDRDHPVWLQYLAGLQHTDDIDGWTYRFFLRRPCDVPPPSIVATFGCFSYALSTDGYIRLHFQNAEATGRSPLDIKCLAARMEELRSLFQHVDCTQPAMLRVAGVSWLYNVPAYRRLFPASYLESARLAGPRFRNLPLWGQFLDRHGAVRQGMVAPFLACLSCQADMDDIARCFPLQALAVEAPVSDFRDFYESQRGA